MMKKRWILFMMCACISGLGGCGKQTVTEKAEETETADSMKEDTTELCAYIKEINGNTLVIDPVEYISSGDSDRLASYKHTDDDMPDGYYIYNKDEKTEDVTLTDQTGSRRTCRTKPRGSGKTDRGDAENRCDIEGNPENDF